MTASLQGQRSSVQVLWVPQPSLEHTRVTGGKGAPGRAWSVAECRTRAGCKPSALSVARAHFSAAVEAAAGGAGSSHHKGRQLRRMEHHSHAKGLGVSVPTFQGPSKPLHSLVSSLPGSLSPCSQYPFSTLKPILSSPPPACVFARAEPAP